MKKCRTTPGRILFNSIIPIENRNYEITFGKGELGALISSLYDKYGFEKLVN